MKNRQPIHIETQIKAKVLIGYDGVWKAIKKQKDNTWFVDQIQDEMRGGSRGTIKDYLSRLVIAGYVKKGDRQLIKSRWRPTYQTVRPVKTAPALHRDGTPANEQGRGQGAMWWSIKMMKKFTIQELIEDASISEEEAKIASVQPLTITKGTARGYIRHLVKIGYVKLIDPEVERYWMVPSKWTGPKAPMLTEATFVFDPNIGLIVGVACRVKEIFK